MSCKYNERNLFLVTICSSFLFLLFSYFLSKQNGLEIKNWDLNLHPFSLKDQLTVTTIYKLVIILGCLNLANETFSLLLIFDFYEMYSNNIKTEAVFTMKEMNNKWNINFLQNSPFSFNLLNNFSTGWSTTETSLLIWLDFVV